ncbi:MAG: hypothetical protein A3I11_02300 [Elusimicrobia bacterium RIFCSPLOWO2_02_FULL_39_32]|nr:MAG: hypothetical protein A2034_03645 [Elusimicrobia bacterium GWA2_38_7]OGR78449.1 MAG: hypothetical protein A3B80_07185 [Elusimicrobia bacterium RIFCSPHIGHO2_02_FULL_39_36]OGR92208.1 MAG: hypothetical protein A3I11_02300 [Elusimicrobia bacterium RIFCSPLOWO2_02_FULL_39_32]OGR99925.1 MAG: hypothetical protein A3G85_03140 [Elusimicrobia bacterium RIFCSPLOWO2_12_FULL_39_28]
MIENFIPLLIAIFGILILSVAIYFAVRYFAYKRSFPLPHRFDFLWILLTFLTIFLTSFTQGPLEGSLNQTFLTWTTFATLLLFFYVMIFILDQFLVEYFLCTVMKIYISPPLRKAMVLFGFVVAVVIAVQKIFSINPWAVYAPTSLLSLGIGIALKDTFQTFFAGVALSKVVHIGDWIQLGDKEGEVLEISWARTVLRSWEGDHLFIPNSELQKGMFLNYSYKSKRHRCKLEVGVSYSAPPKKVKSVLLNCLQNLEGIVAHPLPEVILKSYGDSAIIYNLTFWTDHYAIWRKITSDVATRVWYALKREGLEIPFPIRTVQLFKKKIDGESRNFDELLSKIDLFKMLSNEEKEVLVQKFHFQTFLEKEIVVEQGQMGSSFYLVLKGKLVVMRTLKDGNAITLGELGEGQFFGELSLLTGEAISATVKALEDSELLMLEKNDFKEILNRHPALSDNLAEVVTARQTALSGIQEKSEIVQQQTLNKSVLSKKIRNFFNLKN